MQKINYVCIAIGCLCIGLVIGSYIGYKISVRGATDNSSRERELIARLAEYQYAEAERIERERRSIEETDRALRELSELDRRSGDLYTYIGKKLDILENYWNSRTQYVSGIDDDTNSEVK